MGEAKRRRDALLTRELVRRQPLNAMAEVVEERRRLEARLPRLVADARREGRTWAEIGRALGVTVQAAHQRFGRVELGPGREL